MLELPHILLVDDDAAVGEAFRRRARGLFRVTTTTDPKQALAILSARHHFAAVLSDLFMPRTNGLDFLRAARTLAPQSKFYLFTGKIDHGNIQNDLAQARVARMFFKPLDALLLHQALKADLCERANPFSRLLGLVNLSRWAG